MARQLVRETDQYGTASSACRIAGVRPPVRASCADPSALRRNAPPEPRPPGSAPRAHPTRLPALQPLSLPARSMYVASIRARTEDAPARSRPACLVQLKHLTHLAAVTVAPRRVRTAPRSRQRSRLPPDVRPPRVSVATAYEHPRRPLLNTTDCGLLPLCHEMSPDSKVRSVRPWTTASNSAADSPAKSGTASSG